VITLHYDFTLHYDSKRKMQTTLITLQSAMRKRRKTDGF